MYVCMYVCMYVSFSARHFDKLSHYITVVKERLNYCLLDGSEGLRSSYRGSNLPEASNETGYIFS